MKRRMRHNPLPPPSDFGGRVRDPNTLIERAIWVHGTSPRRLIWALGRVVEDAYREADRRGLVTTDLVEELLCAVQQWCRGRESADRVQELQSELQPLLSWGRGAFEQIMRSAEALAKLVHSELNEQVYSRIFNRQHASLFLVAIVQRSWEAMGEAPKAARARVGRELKASLEGRGR